MARFVLIVVGLIVVIVVDGGVFLMLWPFPGPTGRVEKVFSDAHSPH